MFISIERRKSGILNTGIQYIPGHIEHFVDHVVNELLPEDTIIDLGGGGLRFAIPVALKGKPITVVDIDQGSLDIDSILHQVNSNSKLTIQSEAVKPLIKTVTEDAITYLNNFENEFKLITAFRVIHFYKPEDIEAIFLTIYNSLCRNGLFAVSAITPYISLDLNSRNEIFMNSDAVKETHPLYRQFHDSVEAQNIMTEQNLPCRVTMIDEQYINLLSKKYSFQVIEKNFISTRVVGGYVLKKC